MPIYDFRCPVCGEIKKDVFTRSWEEKVSCEKCKCKMTKVPGIMAPHTFPADGIFLEHVSPEGKLFRSKKEMKDYARENDLEIGYLE
jgi:putative FmdB family regulatory protein